MEFEQFIRELNNLVNDDQLKEISSGIRYSISSMTRPEKYNFGRNALLNIKQEYINKFSQILEDKFNEQLNK